MRGRELGFNEWRTSALVAERLRAWGIPVHERIGKAIGERYRGPLVNSSLLEVEGTLQREGNGEHLVIHVIATRLFDRSRLLGELVTRPRNFH